jgi:hypothetical protein
MAQDEDMVQEKTDPHRTRANPLTLAALESYGALAGFAAPEPGFSGEEAWSHTYRLWLVAPDKRHAKLDSHYGGFVEIIREPMPGGQEFLLQIRQSIVQDMPGVHETLVRLHCAQDAFASPLRWELTNTVFLGGTKPVPELQVQQEGKIKEGVLSLTQGAHTRNCPLPLPVTSNWSLLDAIQRLPVKAGRKVDFSMLHELDQLKNFQRLSCQGAVTPKLDGKEMALMAWHHTGEGILPCIYYTNQEGRLVAAVSGIRAYLLDPGVRTRHEKQLKLLDEMVSK